jgi:hypothetical protein
MNNDELERRVLDEFIKRAPNPLNINLLQKIFDYQFSVNDIETILERLLVARKVVISPGDNILAFGPNKETIEKRRGILKEQGRFPNYEIELDLSRVISNQFRDFEGVKMYRLIIGTPNHPEEVNLALERLYEYTQHLKKLIASERQKYFANVITLFGIFLTLFTIIDFSITKISISTWSNPWEIFWLSLAQVTPLALVLGGFIFLLHKMFGD